MCLICRDDPVLWLTLNYSSNVGITVCCDIQIRRIDFQTNGWIFSKFISVYIKALILESSTNNSTPPRAKTEKVRYLFISQEKILPFYFLAKKNNKLNMFIINF